MKRGFEENVPKVRPRVRLGQALDEQVAEAQQVAAAESIAAAPITDVATAREPQPPPPTPIATSPLTLKQARRAVIVAIGRPPGGLAEGCDLEVPIVFAFGSDPVQLRLVASLNRPGRNFTGFTGLSVEIGIALTEGFGNHRVVA